MNDDASTLARKRIRSALILAGLQLGGALLLTLAHKQFGWIDSDTATRGVMVLIGLTVVVIGNSMPKNQEGPPSQTVGDIAVRQSVTRVGGWAMTLGGLVWIGLWALAPRNIAEVGSVAAVGTAAVVMIVYAVYRVRRRSSAN
jgi:hypothetical protein